MPIDFTYVSRLYEELRRELEGFHKRINEIENLRYLEDKLALNPAEVSSGIELRGGMTAELIENAKSAICTNPPRIAFRPMREGPEATKNSSKREMFWSRFIPRLLKVLAELADAEVGLGIGILKAAYYPWPKPPRRRVAGESDAEYNSRQRGLKRMWGPPFKAVTIHPLTYFYRLGAGEEVAESIEHCWKPRRQVYKNYGLPEDTQAPSIEALAASMGQPVENIRALPIGISTETMALVHEYYRAHDLYQVYINAQLVYETAKPPVRYFIAPGRSTSSKDPDKYAFSVAELLRHNEPALNRALTRMAEGVELLVRQRRTLEVPEGYTPELVEGEVIEGENNSPVPRTWQFSAEKVEALPAGAKLVNVYAGAEDVYQAMPFINLVLQLMGQHGVSPLFKGIPPGAAGSGYRDNSLYLMAKSQFQYIIDYYAECIRQFIDWVEQEIVTRVGQEVWAEDAHLRPSDIKGWPCVIEVNIEPNLPQNLIAEGQFFDRMWVQGHVPRRYVVERGLREEQPEKLARERLLEDLQEMMKPQLYQDVMNTVRPPPPTILGPDGNPLPPSNGGNPLTAQGQGSQGQGGVQQLLAEMKAAGQGEAGQVMGGMTRGGQARQPPMGAGEFPPEGAI